MKGYSRRTFLATILVVVAVRTASAVNYCPPVWTQYQLTTGTFCYRLFGMRKTWQEAEDTCRRYTICQGEETGEETAHLVSIGSAEEEDFVSSYWKEMRGPYEGQQGIWLGYHKSAETSGSLWAWLGKLRTPYENWGTHADRAAPTAGNCSQQVANEYAWPKWESVDCDSEQHFICKMHAM